MPEIKPPQGTLRRLLQTVIRKAVGGKICRVFGKENMLGWNAGQPNSGSLSVSGKDTYMG